MQRPSYEASEVLNKFCEVRFGKYLYSCYNVTSLMHFIKLGKNEQRLSEKNPKNLLNISKDQVLKFIDLGAAKIEVGCL